MASTARIRATRTTTKHQEQQEGQERQQHLRKQRLQCVATKCSIHVRGGARGDSMITISQPSVPVLLSCPPFLSVLPLSDCLTSLFLWSPDYIFVLHFLFFTCFPGSFIMFASFVAITTIACCHVSPLLCLFVAL